MTDPAAIEFGTHVRSLRLQASWSQTSLADRLSELGVPTRQPTVAKMEAGRRPTSIPELAALARILRTSMADLLAPVDAALGLTPTPAPDAANAIPIADGPYFWQPAHEAIWNAKTTIRRHRDPKKGPVWRVTHPCGCPPTTHRTHQVAVAFATHHACPPPWTPIPTRTPRRDN